MVDLPNVIYLLGVVALMFGVLLYLSTRTTRRLSEKVDSLNSLAETMRAHYNQMAETMRAHYNQMAEKAAGLERTLRIKLDEALSLDIRVRRLMNEAATANSELTRLTQERDDAHAKFQRQIGSISGLELDLQEARADLDRATEQLQKLRNRPVVFFKVDIDDGIRNSTGQPRGPITLYACRIASTGAEKWHKLRTLSYSQKNVAELGRIVDEINEDIQAVGDDADEGQLITAALTTGR